ncbi:MAG: hypothetical protein DRP66_08580 [Planctomycetota bacterium]|nr:MAG: hypothetical protein DRP66_08580 [Planctomycetota bacterium]
MTISTDISRTQWAREYAQKILNLWQSQEGPLGVDSGYAQHLEEQLLSYFDDPLLRDLVESSY